MTDAKIDPKAEERAQKRFAFLEKKVAEGSADDLVWYGLALEYKSRARIEDALRTFEGLRARTPGYVPMYLMCGQMLADAEKTEAARSWLEEGIVQATAKKDAHALSELKTALGMLD